MDDETLIFERDRLSSRDEKRARYAIEGSAPALSVVLPPDGSWSESRFGSGFPQPTKTGQAIIDALGIDTFDLYDEERPGGTTDPSMRRNGCQ
jgi:hypothetical protein